MATTFYLRSTSGAACGPGTRYALSETAGSSASQIDVVSETTWNVAEARKFFAGAWSTTLQVTVGSGGGAQNRVTAVIEKRSSACSTTQTILSVQSGNLSTGAQSTVTLTGSSVTAEFAPGDILLLRIVRSQGTRTTTVTAESTTSFITAPDAAVPGSTLKYWTGSTWGSGELKKWTGTVWDGAVLKRWNGTAWVEVP